MRRWPAEPPGPIARTVDSIADAVRAGIGTVAQLVSGLLRVSLGAVSALVLGASGCGSDRVDAAVAHPAPASEPAPAPAKAPETDQESKPIGHFSITFYYMIGEDEVAARSVAKAAARAREQATESDDASADPIGELAAITVPEPVTIYDGRSCEPISEVSKEFAAQLALQGTGKLKDGRVVNVWGQCDCGHSPCFKVTSSKWGTAGNGRPLQPYRTVAVDPKVIKLGTLLYVPLLEGRTMPGRAPWGGFVHDGCVVADDVGGGIKDRQLDLFVGRKGHYLGMSGSAGSHAWARHVPVYDGSKLCERNGRKVGRKTGAI